jgi:hypothetical protein
LGIERPAANDLYVMGRALQPPLIVRDGTKSLPLFGLRAALAVANSGELSPGRLRFQSRLSAIFAFVMAVESLPIVTLSAKYFTMRVAGGLLLALAVMFAVQALNCRNFARRAAAARATGSES